MQKNKKDESTNQNNQAQINIVAFYLKDVSFESPESPAVFQRSNAPNVSFNFDTTHRPVSDGLFEVTLKVRVTAKETPETNSKTLFLTEVQQAGLFTISGLTPEQQSHALGSYCPSILFPYARQVVANLTSQGNFPTCQLPPINFDAIYFAQQQKATETEVETEIA